MESKIIECVHNDNDTEFTFTDFNSYESDGLIHCEVCFIPNVTIKCKPPFIKGKVDSRWIKYRKGNKPKNKEALEECIGMSIQAWE